MKTVKRSLFAVLFAILSFAITVPALAQDKVSGVVGADIVSSYLWRGLRFDAAPNFQPWMEVGYKGFALGAWGSYNFTGTYSEPDLYLAYRTGGLAVTFTDYFAGSDDYFRYKSLNADTTTKHTMELMASYTVSQEVPLKVTAGTLVMGYDPKTYGADSIDVMKNNFSTYLELAYTAQLDGASLDVFAGLVPTATTFYGTDGFGLINFGVKGQRDIKITEDFTLPVKLWLMSNPDAKKMYFALGFSF